MMKRRKSIAFKAQRGSMLMGVAGQLTGAASQTKRRTLARDVSGNVQPSISSELSSASGGTDLSPEARGGTNASPVEGEDLGSTLGSLAEGSVEREDLESTLGSLPEGLVERELAPLFEEAASRQPGQRPQND